jgi:hypothetical protein
LLGVVFFWVVFFFGFAFWFQAETFFNILGLGLVLDLGFGPVVCCFFFLLCFLLFAFRVWADLVQGSSLSVYWTGKIREC